MFCPTGLHLVDCFINSFLVTPIMVCYWCGLFELYDMYFNYDENVKVQNSIILTTIGSCFYLAFFAYPLVDRMIRNLHPSLRQNLGALTLMVGGVFHMAYWKGLWMVSEVILDGVGWRLEVAFMIGCLLVKILTASVNTLLFPPFCSAPDVWPDALKTKDIFGNQFPKLQAKPLITYILGTLFTMFFVHLFTVFSWASSLSLLEKLNFDWLGLNYLLAVSCLLSLLLFLLEILLTKLRTCFLKLNDKKSYNIKAVEGTKSRQIKVVTSVSINQSVVINIDKSESYKREIKSPTPFFSLYRFKQLLFDDVLNLILFAVEAIFYKPYWDLFAQTFLVDRFFGAWMLTAVGAILVILSGTCSLFGGLNFSNDIKDNSDSVTDQDNESTDDDDNDEEENYLFHNLYARYFEKL